jgi:hypothetical protein
MQLISFGRFLAQQTDLVLADPIATTANRRNEQTLRTSAMMTGTRSVPPFFEQCR